MSRSDEETLRFIAASIPSVWALEMLLVLKRDGVSLTPDDLVAKLRASELVVSKALDALVAAGLASTDGDSASYLPVSRDVADCVDRIEQLYRTRPNSVRRAIVAARTSTAAAFADAFRLRKVTDD